MSNNSEKGTESLKRKASSLKKFFPTKQKEESQTEQKKEQSADQQEEQITIDDEEKIKGKAKGKLKGKGKRKKSNEADTVNSNNNDNDNGNAIEEAEVKDDENGKILKKSKSAPFSLLSQRAKTKNSKSSDDSETQQSKVPPPFQRFISLPLKQNDQVDPEEDIKNNNDNNLPAIPFRSKSPGTFSIESFNVNGVRASVKNGLKESLLASEADIIFLMEVKADIFSLDEALNLYNNGYAYKYFNGGSGEGRKGYAGVCVYSKVKPIKVSYGLGKNLHDVDGRVITLEFKSVYLVCSYVPNSGQKLEKLDYRTKEWDPFIFDYLNNLNKTKRVIWCGDLNVARTEIDLQNPKGKNKTAGFTPAERSSIAKFLENPQTSNSPNQNLDWVDVYRSVYPAGRSEGFTYWSHRFQSRQKGIGWRLDYFIVSQPLLEEVKDIYVGSEINLLSDGRRVRSSDHAPLFIEFKTNHLFIEQQ